MDGITSHFVTVGDRQVHYRRAGSGPPIVLLHPSPSWARGLDGYTRVFADGFTAIALDTPGYGLSDGLGLDQPEIGDFAEALRETLDALGIERAGIFGSHTGASIAIEFVRSHPARVSVAVFDGYPVYEAERAQAMLDHYLVPYVPAWDGSHLLLTWHKFREQFIFNPAFLHHRENRTDSAPWPAEATQAGVLPRLITGERYADAYAAVFRYDGLAPVRELAVPTCFAAREGDSLIKAMPLLGDLPDGCWTQVMPRDQAAAAQGYLDVFRRHPPAAAAPPPPAVAPRPGRVSRDYVATGRGQVLVRRAGEGPGTPLVVLPQVPGGGEWWDDVLPDLATGRAVLAVDLPGNGDSDDDGTAPAIPALAEALGGILDRLDLGAVTLLGHNGGASVAVELARRQPGRVRRLVLLDPLCLEAPLRLALAPRYGEPVVPAQDGSHLLRLWFALRGEQLFWPWYNESVEAIRDIEPQIDPRRLSRRLAGLLKHYPRYHVATAAAIAYPLRERLADLPAGLARVATRESDVFHRFAADAAALHGGEARQVAEDGPAFAAGLAPLLAD